MGESVLDTIVAAVTGALKQNLNATASAAAQVNATAAPPKVPATPEGIAIAYGSIVVMAVLPVFYGAFRSVKHQKKQKVGGGNICRPGSARCVRVACLYSVVDRKQTTETHHVSRRVTSVHVVNNCWSKLTATAAHKASTNKRPGSGAITCRCMPVCVGVCVFALVHMCTQLARKTRDTSNPLTWYRVPISRLFHRYCCFGTRRSCWNARATAIATARTTVRVAAVTVACARWPST